MDLGDFEQGPSQPTAYSVTLTLTVEDARALWTAAADRALTAPGMTLADVLDTLGPREDPSIPDCIAMLTAPQAIAGCGLDNFTVREAITLAAPAQPIRLPTGEPGHLRLMPAANG